MAKLKCALEDGFTHCAWVGERPHCIRYHDEEWGVPIHDDQRHLRCCCWKALRRD
jgi:3-methyladenine DNA glycosylase Tag